MEQLLADLAHRKRFSFRTIERIVGVLAVAMATKKGLLRAPPIMIGLSMLKVVEPELYLKAKDRRLTYVEIKDALGIEDDEGWEAEWWRFCFGELPDEAVARFGNMMFKYNFSEPYDIITITANSIIDSFKIEGR
jgi:hypothetical protein